MEEKEIPTIAESTQQETIAQASPIQRAWEKAKSFLNSLVPTQAEAEYAQPSNPNLTRRQFLIIGAGGLLAACGYTDPEQPSTPIPTTTSTQSPPQLPQPDLFANKVFEVTGKATPIEYIGYSEQEKSEIQEKANTVLEFLAAKVKEAGVSKNIWSSPTKVKFTKSPESSYTILHEDGSIEIGLSQTSTQNQVYHIANEFFSIFIAMRSPELSTNNPYFIIGDAFSTIFSLEFEKKYPDANGLTAGIEQLRRGEFFIPEENYTVETTNYYFLNNQMKSMSMQHAFERLNWKVAVALLDAGVNLTEVFKLLDKDQNPSENEQIQAALTSLEPNFWGKNIPTVLDIAQPRQVIFPDVSTEEPIFRILSFSSDGPLMETTVKIFDESGAPVPLASNVQSDSINIKLPAGFRGKKVTIRTGFRPEFKAQIP